ncbi:MAG: glycosyltransferase family 4 protein [Solirubrobacteraceae bacterium]
MRVIQCADYGAPYQGSFIPMLAAVAREAAGRGYPPTILLSGSARDREWVGELRDVAEVRILGAADSRRALVGNAMRELGSDGEPTVIHSHFVTFDIPAALMRLRSRDIGVLWHEHGPQLTDPRVRLRNALRVIAMAPLVDAILCVSPEIRDDLRARHVPAGKLHYFPNAVDTTRFSAITDAERRASRQALDIPQDARVVLHFGWDWERKGGDLMLGAAELLAAESDVVLLTVLGERRLSLGHRDAELPSNVRTLPPVNDVKALYAATDVFLSASRSEGQPLAALEALACGLPVVVTDIPMQERLVAGLPGAVAVAADPAAIAAGLRAMLALSEQRREEHVTSTQERFASYFALDAWARRLVDLYESVLRGRAGGTP